MKDIYEQSGCCVDMAISNHINMPVLADGQFSKWKISIFIHPFWGFCFDRELFFRALSIY